MVVRKKNPISIICRNDVLSINHAELNLFSFLIVKNCVYGLRYQFHINTQSQYHITTFTMIQRKLGECFDSI